MFPWILCGILLISVLLLIGKIILLKRSMDEICTEFKEHLLVDTNTLVSISSNDAHVKKSADQMR